MEQHTQEWYKARLGKITGSMVYVLMGTPRKKGETFTDTAKNYLYQLAAERNLNDAFKDTYFDEYLERVNVETRAMRYGTDTEALARQAYDMRLSPDLTVEECGFFQHPTLPNYGDSPDGLVWTKARTLTGCIEVKCPNPNTWMRYLDLFKQGFPLKEVEEKYYWQCQSHILCTGADWCDFIFYDKMQRNPLQVQRIGPCDDDLALMIERITLAEEFIGNIVN